MTTRAKYTDADRIPSGGYDIVQPKYDGWYCRAVSTGSGVEYYSETNRLFHTLAVELPVCVLLGEYMRGTQWSKDPSRYGKFFVFDLLSVGTAENGIDLTMFSYAARYRKLRAFAGVFPPNYEIVPCFPVASAREVWDRYVEKEGYEGVVYRRSTGVVGDEVVRHKKVFTLDGVVEGISEGQGKHLGRAGTLDVRLPDGSRTMVGNGFSDGERQDMLDNPKKYLERTMEFVANKVFESGNVRHGRFVRWRDDR